MAFMLGMEFHEGEMEMSKLLKNPPGRDNPTAPMLTPQAARMLQVGPLLALGVLDKNGQPWTTLLGGQAPLASILSRSMIGIRAAVDDLNDPVIEALFSGMTSEEDEEKLAAHLQNKMLSGLTLDLETRKRVKLFGHIATGVLETSPSDAGQPSQTKVNLNVRIDQSLGNCPKYLNCKHIVPTPLSKPSTLISTGPTLSQEALEIIASADLFFVTSTHSSHDMDTNHRGGPAGFTRTAVAENGATQIIWPEYSGNRLYQTLGNLLKTPKAGLVFPDFESGDAIFVTGSTEVLIGPDAEALIPRSNLAVRLTVFESRFVKGTLPYRGERGESSPYNPRVRPLRSEAGVILPEKSSRTATLVAKDELTPTVNRYRFSLDAPGREAEWRPGQWVALDFSAEMDLGYSHMRDDDPGSINDDYIRTFTVSSPPGKSTMGEFEITIRKVGSVTDYLARINPRGGLEVGLRGFGGDLEMHTGDLAENEKVAFIAGGVGITPVLGALGGHVDLERCVILWGVRGDDLGLVSDTVKRNKGVEKALKIFVTGKTDDEKVSDLESKGVQVEKRRMEEKDVKIFEDFVKRWYICTQLAMRERVSGWLKGKELLFEDFNF